MSFEYDIFISYGWVDDEDPAGDMKGWVDLLVERLPRVVASYLGDKPRLWRDERSLRGNDLLASAINDGVARSRLFVPVVSPRYVLSEWCRKELEAFCATDPTAGAGPHRSRIFKVIKTPLLLPHLKEPEQLRELIGYSFYALEGDRPREFSPDVTPAKDQRYWDALGRLAWDITNTLVALRSAPEAAATTTTRAATTPARADSAASNGSPNGASNSGAGAAAKPVYLAESTSDLAKEREQVRDELRQRGYEVLPEQRLPLEERRLTEEAVRRDLARCPVSVHMVGTRYGSTPEDDPASAVQIQESLAAERGEADPSFRRILWMPPGLSTPALEVTDARQRDFISELQTRVKAGAELLQTTVEELKTRVVEKLTAAERAEAEKANSAAGAHQRQKLKQVYLICENSDRSFVRPIRQYLHNEKFEVITWLEGEGGTAADRLMEYHRKNLRECDAALIYFGSGDEPWVRKNLEDLEKAYGYGREDDWTASAVYVGAPTNPDKEDFLTNMVPYVIHNFSGFSPEDLRDFVKAVREAEGGAQ
jgi:hypothetical protein